VIGPVLLLSAWFVGTPHAAAAACAPGFQDAGGGICLRDFAYTGAPVTITLPGVGVLTAKVSGGQGGDSREEGEGQSSLGGRGGRQTATLPVVPGVPLTVLVGRAGADGGLASYGGGYGGGGNPASNYGGGGGGGSFVFDADGVLVAAGGGGGGGYDPNPTYSGGQIPNSMAPGGAGSGNAAATDGQSAAFCCDPQLDPVPPGGGHGATPTTPGTGGSPAGDVPPSFGPVAGETGWGPAVEPDQLGKGGDSYRGNGSGGGVGWAGGGGGGYYGGGGGGNIEFWLEGGGGGGGAGWVDPAAWNGAAAVGVQPNDGMVTLSYSRTQPAAPSITSFSPRIAVPGQTVTVEGSNLAGTTSVRFGGVPAASFMVDGPTRVRATVPPDAVDGPIEVSTKGGTATSPGSFVLSHHQPDALVKAPGAFAFVGDGIYNGTASDQTGSASGKRGATRVWTIRIQNDGDVDDSVTVAGPGTTAAFSVRYLAGGAPVTRRVVAGTYVIPNLPPGAFGTLRFEVTVRPGARVGAAGVWLLRAASSELGRRDAVRARLTVIAG
jgi:hypothetical protein